MELVSGRNEFLGLAGMVTLNSAENESFAGIPINDASTRTAATQDVTETAGGKRFSLSVCRKIVCSLWRIVSFEIDTHFRRLHRTIGANRSLPDIPKDKRHEDIVESVSQDIYETTETIADNSELYVTVQDTGNFKLQLESCHGSICSMFSTLFNPLRTSVGR